MKITTQNLSKRFNREWIFRGISQAFSSGNTYAITGPNGSGKSTLLQVLWGQMPPSSGTLEFEKSGTLIPIEDSFRNISIATPYMDLIEEFTLTEHLQFHFRLKKSRNNLSISEIMKLMYLESASDKQISNFSSGMRQRLKLGLAFFTEAEILFLDEPTTNLDKTACDWYQDQLHKIPSTNMVFIASNQPNEYPEDAHIINIMSFK